MHLEKWKDELNKTSLLFARTLEPGEWQIWGKFLEDVPDRAVEYAFSNWQKNGRFFPKPKDILDLVAAFEIGRDGTTRISFEHYGKGYGGGDFKALWKMVSAKSIGLGRKLTEPEIWEALGEIDKKRPGGAPAFRR